MKRMMILLAFTVVAGLALDRPAQGQVRSDGDRREEFRRDDRPRTYVFGAKAHVLRLATELSQETNTICWEMHRNYKNSPRFREIYRDMFTIKDAAKRIEDLARRNYFRQPEPKDRIVGELYQIDDLFQDVVRDVRRWHPDHPDRKSDLLARLDECEETVHHMMEDYGIRRRHHDEHDHDHDRDHGPRR